MGATPKPQHILVVEDDRALRQITARILHDAGFTVSEAESGVQALEQLAAKHPDLLITDNRMPDMGGNALIAGVRARFPDLPILRISGSDTIAGSDRSVPTLAKPFSVKDLLAAVQGLLGPRA
jgi:DNA-binding response OmpR family regulator